MKPGARNILALAAAVLAFLWIAAGLRPPSPAPGEFDFAAFGRLPVLADGRVKNFDSLARESLLALQARKTVLSSEGDRIGAVEWLLTLIARPERADDIPVFLVHHPDLLAMLGQAGESRHRFSFDDIRPHGAEIQRQAEMARELDREDRSVYQEALLKLDYSLALYWRLRHSLHFGEADQVGEVLDRHQRVLRPILRKMREQPTGSLPDADVAEVQQAVFLYSSFADLAQFFPIAYPHPEKPRGEWVSLGESLARALDDVDIPPHVTGYRNVIERFAAGDADGFNAHTRALSSWLRGHFPEATDRASRESLFNRLDLFWKCAALYLGAFLLLCAFWVAPRLPVDRAALALILTALAAHTIGLAFRMYIQERPPVTNLYASAVFVGWGAVILALLLEKIHRNTIGAAVAALWGFLTLVVAHNLGNDGDTAEVMRAVLNSNFWLATHVVIITIGYAAAFVAAGVGALAILGNLRRGGLGAARWRASSSMIYGIVCFGLLFSFAGTVLGGIWADQSWGRFWGWDPKENGALMIVLWLAIILHLRWGGMIGPRGMAVGAVFAGVIVSFAWFGVNMLGVGLHAYGFMDGAPFWLGLYMTSQLAIMGLAFWPGKSPP